MSRTLDHTLLLIKPDASHHEAAITEKLKGAGLTVLQRRRVQLTEDQVAAFYTQYSDRPYYQSITAYLSSAPVTVLMLGGLSAVELLKTLAGPSNPDEARKSAPESLHALFGSDYRANGVHVSRTIIDARHEVLFFFPTTEFEPLPGKDEVKEYLENKVYPALTKGLAQLCREKPADPALWLGNWLSSNNPMRPTVIEPEQ